MVKDILNINDCIFVLCFIVADIATGLVKAFSSGSYTSAIMRTGLFHKLGELLAFIFGILCDIALPNFNVQLPISITRAIALYIVAMEIGSIVENIGITSPSIGKFISGFFAKVQDSILTQNNLEVIESEVVNDEEIDEAKDEDNAD